MKYFPLPPKSISIHRQPLQGFNGWWIFGGICAVYLFSSYYLQTAVLTDQVYYNSLGNEHTSDQVEHLIQDRRSMGFMGYILVPVVLMAKVLFTFFCLYTGLLLTSNQVAFKALFKIVLFAESAFVLATLTRLVLIAFFVDLETFDSIRFFSPLSLLNLFNPADIPNYLVYPLQTISIFEVLYIILLAVGLQYHLGRRFKEMLVLVLISYGPGLLSWMALIAFISMSIAN